MTKFDEELEKEADVQSLVQHVHQHKLDEWKADLELKEQFKKGAQWAASCERKRSEKLLEALEPYANGDHFHGEWENPSGEPLNILCLTECECDVGHYIEDGSVAKKAIKDYKAEESL